MISVHRVEVTEELVVTLTIESCTEEDEGSYTLEITNSHGSDTSSADVFIDFDLPTFTQPLRDITVTVDSPVVFECKVQGLPVPETTWHINHQVVTESDKYHVSRHEDTATLEISNVTPEDTDVTYECRAHNVAGEANTAARLILQGVLKVILNYHPHLKFNTLLCMTLEYVMHVFLMEILAKRVLDVANQYMNSFLVLG